MLYDLRLRPASIFFEYLYVQLSIFGRIAILKTLGLLYADTSTNEIPGTRFTKQSYDKLRKNLG